MNDDASSVGSFAASAAHSDTTLNPSGGESRSNYGVDPEASTVAQWIVQKTGFQELLFEVLYPISKVKYTASQWFAACFILLEFTQLSAYFLDPAVGFSMDHSFWIWEYWRKSQMWVPLTQVSHQLYLIVLYLTLVLIGVTILLVYYLKFEAVETATTVSRKIRTFRSIVRFLLSTLFSMFFISTFGVMMASIECNYEGPEMGNLKLFPGRACDEMPYIVHGLFALSGLVAFIAGRLQTLNPKP
mmetsp:Transcript_29208/g.93344  ORF Transcript_29208/g.93344 Transcript_29208/m.93344 type:complete len:244 (-) Transcript_29208:6268-6999(-)